MRSRSRIPAAVLAAVLWIVAACTVTACSGDDPIGEVRLVGCATTVAGPRVDTCFYNGGRTQDLARGDVTVRVVELRSGREIGQETVPGKETPTCKTFLVGYEATQEIQYGPPDIDRIFLGLQSYFIGSNFIGSNFIGSR